MYSFELDKVERLEDIIKYHAWVGTKLINSVENLLKRYKELEEEIALMAPGRFAR